MKKNKTKHKANFFFETCIVYISALLPGGVLLCLCLFIDVFFGTLSLPVDQWNTVRPLAHALSICMCNYNVSSGQKLRRVPLRITRMLLEIVRNTVFIN